MGRAPLFGRVRSSTVRLSSTLECVPELLNLLWGQLLAPAHNAQHLFALDLALPFASNSVFTRSQSAWESKSLVKSSRRGSVVAGSPARTAAMIRRDFKGLLRRFLLPAQK